MVISSPDPCVKSATKGVPIIAVEECLMSTTPVVAPDSGPALSPIRRIPGVFFSPKATFQDIAEKPSWLAPVAVMMIIWLGLNIALVKHADWVEISKDQISKSKFASRQFEQLNDDQKAHAYEQAGERAKIVRYVRAVIGWPLLLLITAGIYLGLFKLIGGARRNFASAFALTAFAHLPICLKELISIPVVVLKDPSSIDPGNFF